MVFNAKILLFGEYTIINGSKALAIPYPKYSGQWKFSSTSKQRSLPALASYLKEIMQEDARFNFFNIEQFQKDIDNGIFFQSSIKEGYGMGSSGALCAAICHKYFEHKHTDFITLQSVLAKIESYFHGASSGLDPLVSYLNKGVLIVHKNELEIIEIEHIPTSGFFLIDTLMPRKTQPLVQIFLEKCKDLSFKQRCENTLAQLTDEAIGAFLVDKPTILKNALKKISIFQFQYFTEMIPLKFRAIWQAGLVNEQYCLKLCGAGGGGYILGYSDNFQATFEQLASYNIEKIIL